MYKFAINRPIATLMFSLGIIFFGVLGFKKIPTALFPNIDFPIVLISTVYPGASPTTIESKVTDKVEEQVLGIDGLKQVTSMSVRNTSLVIVQFQLDKPMDQAVSDVINKVSSVTFTDADIRKPAIDKIDTNGQAIISLFLSSATHSQPDLMKHADNIIKPQLQKVSGVGGVQLNGYRERQVRIYPDPTLMAKYNITYPQIAQAIGRENTELDGGRIVNETSEFAITTDGNSPSVEKVGDIRITDNLLLRDVAVVEDGLEEYKTYAAFDGVGGVIMEVQKISGANDIAIADGVYKALPMIQAVSPGYDVRTFLDTTEFIRASLHDIEVDLILGGILAVSIVFVFLRNVTITLVSAISIPISVLGTFALVQMMGYSLNMLTMMAITLSIGIIIDDAIVVIENIHKKLESGMQKREAAYQGVREIAFAIFAISAMLLSVFIPVGNMSGIIGKFFQSFGITVALAIGVSYIVVMTVVPMVSSLVVSPKQSRFYHWSEPYFVKMQDAYARTLKVVMKQKTLVTILVFGVFAGSIVVLSKLGMDFMLKEDRSQMYFWVQTKPGISIYDMRKKTEAMQRAIMADSANVEYTTIQVAYGKTQNTNKSKIYVKLKDEKQRNVDQFSWARAMAKTLYALPEAQGLVIIPAEVPLIGGGDNSALQVVIYSPTQALVDESAAKLKSMLLEGALKGSVVDYHESVSDWTPEYRLHILRQNANQYGITAQDIGQAISSAFAGENKVGYYKENGKEYSITLRVPDNRRLSVEDIKRIQIKTASGESVFIDGLVEIEESSMPSIINRYNRQRSITIYANPAEKDGKKVDLGTLLRTIDEKRAEWAEEGVGYVFSGEADNLAETQEAFAIAVATAFVLIYLILAALYESILEPIIIMVTMPLSFSGAFFALGIVGQPLSMFSLMGLILLIGMVGKNATLLIDVANEKREEGYSIADAILLAGELRLRPILMTTIAMVFGMLPLAFATGQGSSMKSAIGICMIGGLIVSMFLSLLIVPVFYRILAPIDDKIKKFYKVSRDQMLA